MPEFLAMMPIAVFAVFGFQLAQFDFKYKILPNRLVANLIIYLVSSCLAISAVTKDWSQFSSALRFAVGYLIVFVLLYLLSRGKLGMGDVKFAIPCGLIVGWSVSYLFMESLILMFGCAGVVSLFLLTTRKINLNTHIPFGPFMYFSVLLTCLVSNFSG